MRTVRCSGRLSCHARPREDMHPNAPLPCTTTTHPSPRMTDACENITFPQLLLRTVNIAILTPVNSVVTTTEKDVLITAFGIYLFMGEEVGNVTCIMG